MHLLSSFPPLHSVLSTCRPPLTETTCLLEPLPNGMLAPSTCHWPRQIWSLPENHWINSMLSILALLGLWVLPNLFLLPKTKLKPWICSLFMSESTSQLFSWSLTPANKWNLHSHSMRTEEGAIVDLSYHYHRASSHLSMWGAWELSSLLPSNGGRGPLTISAHAQNAKMSSFHFEIMKSFTKLYWFLKTLMFKYFSSAVKR